jgi:hypothetical protein
MKDTHTPGPWTRLDRPENALEDARILTHVTNGAHIICTLGSTCTDGSPTHSANASLLASAPELLSALEDAEFLLRKFSHLQGPMQDSFKRSAADARAAIAKAKGEA